MAERLSIVPVGIETCLQDPALKWDANSQSYLLELKRSLEVHACISSALSIVPVGIETRVFRLRTAGSWPLSIVPVGIETTRAALRPEIALRLSIVPVGIETSEPLEIPPFWMNSQSYLLELKRISARHRVDDNRALNRTCWN